MYGRYPYEFMKKIRMGVLCMFGFSFPPHRRKVPQPSPLLFLRLTPRTYPKTGPQFKFSKILAVSLWSVFGKVVFLLVLHESSSVVRSEKWAGEKRRNFLISLESWPAPDFTPASGQRRSRTRFPISHVYREMKIKAEGKNTAAGRNCRRVIFPFFFFLDFSSIFFGRM